MPNNIPDNMKLTDITETVRKIDRFRGVADTLIQQKARIIMEIDSAQHYLDRKDEVLNALEALQERTQAKTKEIYEVLLTQLIHEVKGYDEENHRLVLKTRMKKNRPWLDIEMESASGHPRDVYLDKGGSILNIVAMGLRFITLSRTSNRRFLVFDESDKDLNPKYIPGIAKMLIQLAQQVGMQVLYISHHDPANFEGYAKIVNVSRVKGAISTEVISDIEDGKIEGLDGDDIGDYMEGIGVKYIRLLNVKQHENTIIELSPFVTVITGDNDIGKSTVVQAIDAVNKNKGREGLIRDNHSSCRIELGLEDDTTLSWSYKRRGSKRTLYRMTDQDNIELQQSDSGTQVPNWLSDYLGMALYKDFDLHVSNQHNANFILDSSISGHRRAEILSLGKETNQVMAMIKLHGQQSEKNVKLVNQLKRELTEVKNRLEVYRQLNNLEEMIQNSLSRINEVNTNQLFVERLKKRIHNQERLDAVSSVMMPLNKINQIAVLDIKPIGMTQGLIKDLDRLRHRNDLLQQVGQINIPKIPEYKSFKNIAVLGGQLAKLQEKRTSLTGIDNIKILSAPETKDLTGLSNSITLLAKLGEQKESMSTLPSRLPNIPVLMDNQQIIKAGEQINLANKGISESQEGIEKNQLEIKNSEQERQELIHQLGEDCPVCGGKIHEEAEVCN